MKQPNLLVVMSDQHAPSFLGRSGHAAVRTPNLDRLAERGVTFSQAYCNYPMCTPTRASFMTGLQTPQHRLWELGDPLGTDLPSWAHALRRSGYRTSIAGRMHFVGPDQMHGFETRVHPGLCRQDHLYPYGDWDVPPNDQHLMVDCVTSAGPTDEPTRAQLYDTSVITAAEQHLEMLTQARDGAPWAMAVGTYLPHIPYAIERRWFDLYRGEDIPMPVRPPAGSDWERHIPPLFRDSRRWLGLTSDGASEQQVRTARRAYCGMVTCLDDLIGRLLAKLEETGQADNTWVVYLSDHGDNMGEHGMWSKLNFFEESVRIPLIIAPPGCRQAGRTCAAPVSQIDWLPTVLDLTGDNTWSEPLPGRSLRPLIENPEDAGADRIVRSDYACEGTRVPLRMVRQGRWKACFGHALPPVLFDLQRDPNEWHDLGQEPAQAGRIAELERLARADGWDSAALQPLVATHKRRLKLMEQAVKPTG